MNNTQQDDITADLTDERLLLAAAKDYRNRSSGMSRREARYRAVARLAREGWRPIRSNALPVAEGESQELSQQLHEPVAVLESLQIPHRPGRVLRAAELLGQQQASTSMPSEIEELARWVEVRAKKAKIPQYYMKFKRIAALLRQQQVLAPVPASERPWEQEGWCDEQGRCWMADPGDEKIIPSWHLCRPKDATRMIWSLPHWAISIPASTNTSS